MTIVKASFEGGMDKNENTKLSEMPLYHLMIVSRYDGGPCATMSGTATDDCLRIVVEVGIETTRPLVVFKFTYEIDQRSNDQQFTKKCMPLAAGT
jgi:hypothetical protein